MYCPCVIVTSQVAGPLLAGVINQPCPVVHSEFPPNIFASHNTGTFAEIGISFP